MFNFFKLFFARKQFYQSKETVKLQLEKDERYNLYLNLRKEYYECEAREQDKADALMVNGALTFMAVAFTYVGLQKGCRFDWTFFYYALCSDILCLLGCFFSFKFVVWDVQACRPELDECYGKGGDLSEPIESWYYSKVDFLNNFAMMFFVISIICFGIFVGQTSENIFLNKSEKTIVDADVTQKEEKNEIQIVKEFGNMDKKVGKKKILTEGSKKPRPPKPKK